MTSNDIYGMTHLRVDSELNIYLVSHCVTKQFDVSLKVNAQALCSSTTADSSLARVPPSRRGLRIIKFASALEA
jgi:hypothetical protein